MRQISLTVDEAGASERLDQLIARLGNISRGEARRTIERGGVWANGKRLRRASGTLSVGGRLEVYLLSEAEVRELERFPKALTAEQILFQDDALVCVDKPAGVPAQPTPACDAGNDLISMTSQALSGARLWAVHRLDRQTSGVSVLARTKQAAAALSVAFARHQETQKRYLALAARTTFQAAPLLDEGIIDCPIGLDRAHPGKRRAGKDAPEAKEARTHFRVLRRFGEAAILVEALPETGRTHQIRVHLSHLGWPLLGDALYGGRMSLNGIQIPRPMLHAASLQLPHPKTGALFSAEAPLPKDFAGLIRALDELEAHSPA